MSSAAVHNAIPRRRVVNGTVTRELDQTHVRELFTSILVGVILLLSILFYVWQRNEMIRFGYEAKALRARSEALVEENRRLMLQRAGLLALDRIDRIGRRDLKLTTPRADQVFLLQPGAAGDGVMSRTDLAPESLIRER